MSGVGISPSVMINRLVHEARAPGNHLLQVAVVRGAVAAAAHQEQARSARRKPADPPNPATGITGADVDRLV